MVTRLDHSQSELPLLLYPYLKNPRLYFEDQSIRDQNYMNSNIFSSFLMDDYSIEITENKYSESLLRKRMLNELFHESTRVILHEDDLNSMQNSISKFSTNSRFKEDASTKAGNIFAGRKLA